MNDLKTQYTNGSNVITSKSNGIGNGMQHGHAEIGMRASQLMKIFEQELKDIYWTEKTLTKAIPKMIKNATSKELVQILENHLIETEGHVKRLELIFQMIGKRAAGKKCVAIEGLIKEAEDVMETCQGGAMCDACIISAVQKVEHFEMASYHTLIRFAEELGLDSAVGLLQTTLEEEESADENLTEVAFAAITIQSHFEDGEDENETEVIQKQNFHMA